MNHRTSVLVSVTEVSSEVLSGVVREVVSGAIRVTIRR